MSPRWELNREKLEVVVQVPRINTDIDLLNIQKLPFFRVLLAIGTVSDLVYNPVIDNYEPLVFNLHGVSETLTGEWHSTQTILDEHIMTVKMPKDEAKQLSDNVTVLVSMAVEFGIVGFTGQPVEVKYAGCGKVICSR